MKKALEILRLLEEMVPEPKCELEYSKDYELLIAVVLSAQCTDSRVNMVTKELFKKYDIYSLSDANIKDIESIIKPVGTYHNKALYIKKIAVSLVRDYDGHVPNDRKYLESLPGVGRKTCNVVLANIHNEPAIAVDTHVNRVSKRLGLARKNDDVLVVEQKLMKKIPKDKWSDTHHRMVLFGRYICKAQRPMCNNCLLKANCHYYKVNKRNDTNG